MRDVQEIENVQDFLRFLNEERYTDGFPINKADLLDHLSKSKKNRRLIKKYIIEAIQKWRLANEVVGWDNCIIQDIFYLCKLVYKKDESIAEKTKKVILNETNLDKENALEVERFVTLARSYAMAYEVFSERELEKISTLIKDEYPWLWVGVLSVHNWEMTVKFVKNLLKTENEGVLSPIEKQLWFWEDNKTQKQLQYAFNEWKDLLKETEKSYFTKVLNKK